MYRMKGNRDSAGSSTSIIAVDIDPSELGELDSRRPRSGRRRLVAMLAAIIAVLTASSLVSFALVGPGDDSVSTATAISAATVEPSATTVLAAAPSPSTTATTTATATAALSVSVTPTVSASAATPTLQPATSATTAPAAPSATPGRRVRYVVQPGDA